MTITPVDPGSDLVYLGAIHDIEQVKVAVFDARSDDDTVIYLDVDEALAVGKQLRKAAKLAKKKGVK